MEIMRAEYAYNIGLPVNPEVPLDERIGSADSKLQRAGQGYPVRLQESKADRENGNVHQPVMPHHPGAPEEVKGSPRKDAVDNGDPQVYQVYYYNAHTFSNLSIIGTPPSVRYIAMVQAADAPSIILPALRLLCFRYNNAGVQHTTYITDRMMVPVVP